MYFNTSTWILCAFLVIFLLGKYIHIHCQIEVVTHHHDDADCYGHLTTNPTISMLQSIAFDPKLEVSILISLIVSGYHWPEGGKTNI